VGDELVAVLAYSADVFTRPAADHMLARYAGILRELTAAPGRPLCLAGAFAEPVR
jgi:hypothetical protein